MSFELLSPIVLDFDPILQWHQNEGLGMGHNITILKTGLKNELLTSKKP